MAQGAASGQLLVWLELTLCSAALFFVSSLCALDLMAEYADFALGEADPFSMHLNRVEILVCAIHSMMSTLLIVEPRRTTHLPSNALTSKTRLRSSQAHPCLNSPQALLLESPPMHPHPSCDDYGRSTPVKSCGLRVRSEQMLQLHLPAKRYRMLKGRSDTNVVIGRGSESHGIQSPRGK